MDKARRYGESAARDLHARGRTAALLDVLARPAWRFFRAFVLRLGFLDGVPGAQVAWGRAYEAFVRYSLLRELSRGVS